MPLRWISFSRVSMQRPGALVAVAAGASERPTDLAGITRAYAPLLQRSIAVPPDRANDVVTYLRELRLWKRYGRLREADALPVNASVQLQDLWLADPRVPSATGAITDDVVDEPPQLAATLRLIREKNFTLTDRGKALLATALPPRRDAPDQEVVSSNLFLLNPGARAVFLYALLDADADFLGSAYRCAAPTDETEFTRASFADQLNDACRDLKSRWVRRVRTGTERKLLMRLDELAAEIDKPRESGKRWGGGRPPDQTATVRLEPYVDLGLITKLSRSAYHYRISGTQREFFDAVVSADDADGFLDRALFGTYLKGVGITPSVPSDDVIWERIVEAYRTLRSPLGFAAFREVAVLAIARLLDEGAGSFFEVADAVRLLRAKRAEDPRALRFGVARGGALTYMKLVEERVSR